MAIAHRYDPDVPHALYLSNFGGAHGHREYQKSTELITDITKALRANKLLNKEGGYFIYGMTNGIQTNARKLLDQCGFKAHKVGTLVMHSITDKEFGTAAALAAEEEAKEEARLKAEIEKIEKARIERDEKEGRKPGELRVGDVVSYRGHDAVGRRTNQYVIVNMSDKQVMYTSTSQLQYYKIEALETTGNWMAKSDWLRADIDIEAAVLKRYPNLVEYQNNQFLKAKDA